MSARKKPASDLVVARNRKAAHDYHLLESWEAGIVLQGSEVKALRAGRASLVDGFADVDGGEIWLHNVHIPQYAQATWTNHGSRRKRKLLLHRAQIDKIERQVNEGGLTVVPLSLVLQGRAGQGRDRARQGQEDLGQAAGAGRAAGRTRGGAGRQQAPQGDAGLISCRSPVPTSDRFDVNAHIYRPCRDIRRDQNVVDGA